MSTSLKQMISPGIYKCVYSGVYSSYSIRKMGAHQDLAKGDLGGEVVIFQKYGILYLERILFYHLLSVV